MKPRTVIVTDGEQRASLAVIRSLGAQGHRCIVTQGGRTSLAGRSRHCARAVTVPDALTSPVTFAAAITALAKFEQALLVIPIAEPAMLALLPVRDDIAPAIIPFPDYETFRALTDKELLLAEGAALGIAVPEQTVIRSMTDVGSLDAAALTYPIVVKPARSVGEGSGGRTKLSVSYARSAPALRELLQTLPAAAFPVLLQQRVAGPGIGIFLLVWDGQLRAAFAHRRRSEKPPTGGVSVYRESIEIDGELLERSRLLLQRFGWRGVAMIEYKRDAKTGRPYLMEVNGRFWGSLQLAIDAGVDFPLMLARAALDEDAVAPPRNYKVGVRSRWWWGQVDHLIARVPRRRRTQLPPDTVSVARAIADLLLGPFRSADFEEILRWDDPAPFVEETIRWMRARA